jgi:hypothetical protein
MRIFERVPGATSSGITPEVLLLLERANSSTSVILSTLKQWLALLPWLEQSNWAQIELFLNLILQLW